MVLSPSTSTILFALSAFLAISSVLGAQHMGPCDIFDSGATPCVAAHSTTRALYREYNGPLYQVRRLFHVWDGLVLDVWTVEKGGVANSTAQDEFCAGDDCVISRIYDQSPFGNHLDAGPPGGAWRHGDKVVNATKERLMLNRRAVYAAYFEGAMGYRIDNTSGVATGDAPETMYMVTSGKHYNTGCCFDYGNAETDNLDDQSGTMEAIYWGNASNWNRGKGKGPWVMADLENGLWAGSNQTQDSNTPIDADYVFAMVKGDSGNHFAIKGGDAQFGRLHTKYDGVRPPHGDEPFNYNPMRKQGAIILGIGGDNSDSAVGTFYEGAITRGYTSDHQDEAVFKNVVAAQYRDADAW